MNQEQLQILQHALGVDQYGQGKQHRNHFCAGGRDETVCRELVEMGYMETFERSYLPYYNCTVTEAGKKAMAEASLKPPKLTQGQRRYREFLKADVGRSFGEWLKDQSEWRREQKLGATLEDFLTGPFDAAGFFGGGAK